MIKLTIANLIRLTESKMLNKFYGLDRPVKVAWNNRKQHAAVNEELRAYEERRLALCEKYGVKDPKSGNYYFDVAVEDIEKQPKNAPAGPQRLLFNAALAELQAQEVDLPGEPVKVDHLAGHLSDVECLALEAFITD